MPYDIAKSKDVLSPRAYLDAQVAPSQPEITLDHLAVGQSARVQSIALGGPGCTRLMEMGLIPGTIVQLARVAPLGDPIDILIRGYHLSLRRAEAKSVRIDCDTGRSPQSE